MNPRERGFLLLSSHLGNPERKPLTQPQLRTLAQRVQASQKPEEDRHLSPQDLLSLGYSREMASRILALLEEEELLDHYLSKGKRKGCTPITRVSEDYPMLLRQRLGLDSPGCLWAKGELSILQANAVALVGSRDLQEKNAAFAETVGKMAARKGWTLVSGNARGADRTAQEACLAAGGKVISILADDLSRQPGHPGVLYFSEDGYAEGFSAQRALSRNRLIHAMGQVTFVAQSGLGKGGTWDGTVKNLKNGWSTVVCFRDGSVASLELEQMGAYLMDMEQLQQFSEGWNQQI